MTERMEGLEKERVEGAVEGELAKEDLAIRWRIWQGSDQGNKCP
jgi:hypothetical protein